MNVPTKIQRSLWAPACGLGLLAGCQTSDGGSPCGDAPWFSLDGTCQLDTSALDRPPDDAWADAPATVVVGGVEFVDPDGALDGLDLAVTRVDLGTLAPLTGGLEAWSIEPSGALDSIVYARFPLQTARTPGEELELSTLGDDDPLWWTQSVGVVTADGGRALVGLTHFSVQAVVEPRPEQRAFAKGEYCNGERAGAEPLRPNEHIPAGTESATVEPLGSDPPTHAQMQERLTHLGGDAALVDRLLFKNEENEGTSATGCVSYAGEPGYDSEDEYGDAALAEPLRRLADRVRERSCGTLKLMVTEAFDTGRVGKPDGEHSPGSLHYEGRAVDMVLVGTTPEGTVDCSRTRYTPGYARLAQMAAEQDGSVLAPAAAFDFSLFEVPSTSRLYDHVHASMKAAPSSMPMPMPANTLQATVTIGSETIEYVSDSMVRQSNGFDNFILESTESIDGSWMTISLVLPDAEANGTFSLDPELGTSHVAVSFTRDGATYDSDTPAMPAGSVTLSQVPLADKNYLTVTRGDFVADLSDGTVSAHIEGAFNVDDLSFWGL
jgi:hypothetical protein